MKSSTENGSEISVLIYGHRGMLGSDLSVAWQSRGAARVAAERRRHPVGRDLPEFDATNDETVRRDFEKHRPQIVFNCIAYTDVDGCEVNKETARQLNAGVPRRLARCAGEFGTLLVHVSTDFIFDGEIDRPYREEDEPNPLSVYGESKLAGERAVIESGCDYLICRTAWLYGAGGRNFVNTMLRLARSRERVSVVSDQFGSPTWTRDLADMMIKLVEKGARGIVHTVNAGVASWYDLAREAFRLRGLEVGLDPISARDYPRAASPPARSSALSIEKYTGLVGAPPRHWKAALADFLKRWRED